ncbi:hypothetical protein I3842_09G002100 [Carya illinoinensis]|uniref:Adenylyl-sulfate kinase n=1 Tax=Carya illinoinensis TaxID=32201 RepID=A0A922DYX7_CARIL|nr:hypothetical protein I3842_09G002100 [Carya illinoinensis]
MSTLSNSTNIFWQECPVGKVERQKLLNQKGCVVWITGLSGSGKSTLACSLSRELHSRGKLSYVLDGDNLRHGLNKDLSFKPEDRTENIRRVGEVAKLFADAGLICIASLISPYRKDRDACRAMLPYANFIEVFMNMPLTLCEARDTKGLYKLARAGKIKGVFFNMLTLHFWCIDMMSSSPPKRKEKKRKGHYLPAIISCVLCIISLLWVGAIDLNGLNVHEFLILVVNPS